MHIDWWTLAFQTANVLILMGLLAKFLFRPVMDMVENRQREADKLLTDAAEARREADETRAALRQSRAGIAAERNQAIAQARAGADTARTALIAQANDDIARQRTDAAATLARDRTAMERAVIDHARELALDIARKLLSRIGPAVAVDGFVASLSDRLEALPPQERAVLVDAGNVEIVTAAALPEATRERVRHAVAAALGDSAVDLTFATDPAVIAGLELRTRHGAVRNSWRNDLDEITAALAGANTAAGSGGAAAPVS